MGQKNLPVMCMTFHVHERNNDSEKAQFSHRSPFLSLTKKELSELNVSLFFLVNFLSYRCLNRGNGPYLLEAPI